ncbi:tautomerase family protein [Desulfovibrio sp. OttesenSCG-928-I05]|nr:tautomerase family protein [Desulfovibrio sp. OttesenSCG-928-I05]
MPSIFVHMFPGRDVKAKRAFAKAVTDAAVEHLQCHRDGVSIIFSEMATEDFARGGLLKSDELAAKGLTLEEYQQESKE